MQPAVKQKLQGSKDAKGRGFFARCLFVDSRNTEIPTSDDLSEPSEKNWEAYAAGLNALMDFRFSGKIEILI